MTAYFAAVYSSEKWHDQSPEGDIEQVAVVVVAKVPSTKTVKLFNLQLTVTSFDALYRCLSGKGEKISALNSAPKFSLILQYHLSQLKRSFIVLVPGHLHLVHGVSSQARRQLARDPEIQTWNGERQHKKNQSFSAENFFWKVSISGIELPRLFVEKNKKDEDCFHNFEILPVFFVSFSSFSSLASPDR